MANKRHTFGSFGIYVRHILSGCIYRTITIVLVEYGSPTLPRLPWHQDLWVILGITGVIVYYRYCCLGGPEHWQAGGRNEPNCCCQTVWSRSLINLSITSMIVGYLMLQISKNISLLITLYGVSTWVYFTVYNYKLQNLL